MSTGESSITLCDWGCGNLPAQEHRLCDTCRAFVAAHRIPPGAARSIERRLAIQGYQESDPDPVFPLDSREEER